MKRKSEPTFTEAHRRATSDELVLHETCARPDCRRARACRAAGAAFADYPCLIAARDRKRAPSRELDDEEFAREIEIYTAKLTRMLDGMREQSRDRGLACYWPVEEEREIAPERAAITRAGGPSVRAP